MVKLLALLLLKIWMLKASFLAPSLNETYSLDSNLIVNPNISYPIIAPSSFYDFDKTQSLQYTGWATKTVILQYGDPCLLTAAYSLCPIYHGVVCGQQFIDTDSTKMNEQLYQQLELQEVSEYQLQFDWVSQIPNKPRSTSMTVKWNGITVASLSDGSCTLKTSVYFLFSKIGLNELQFMGTGTADSQGLLIRNVRLNKMLYESLLFNITNNTASNNTGNSSTNQNTSINNNTLPTNTTMPPASPFENNSSYILPPSMYNKLDFLSLSILFNGSDFHQFFRMINFLNNFSVTKITNQLSVTKRSLKWFMGFILEFNHFLLFNFHNRNYTIMSNLILSSIQALDDQKGTIIDESIYPFFETSTEQIIQGHQRQNDFPCNINNIVSELEHRQNGLLLDITDLLTFDLPIALMIWMMGYLAFKLLFKYKISLLFRPFSLGGYFLMVLFEGKVETGVFFSISELLLLYTTNFKGKFQIIAILSYFMALIFYAIASMLLYYGLYRKQSKYLFDNCGCGLASSIFMSVSIGPYNLLLGVIHRLFLQASDLQLFLLLTVQILFFIVLIVLLCKNFFENRVQIIVLMCMNIVRISFLISFYFFERLLDFEYEISLVQQYLYFSFLGLWALSSVLLIWEKLKLVCILSWQTFKTSNRIQQIIESPINEIMNNQRELPDAISNNEIQESKSKVKEKQFEIKFSKSKRVDIKMQPNSKMQSLESSYRNACSLPKSRNMNKLKQNQRTVLHLTSKYVTILKRPSSQKHKQ